MKNLILVLALFLFSTVAFAQVAHKGPHHKGHEKGHEKLTPEQRADHMVKKAKENLNLSGDQVEKLHAIMLERAHKMEEIHQSHQKNQEAMRAEMKAAMLERNKDVKEILTPEQYEKFIAQQTKMMEKHKEKHMKGNRPE